MLRRRFAPWIANFVLASLVLVGCDTLNIGSPERPKATSTPEVTPSSLDPPETTPSPTSDAPTGLLTGIGLEPDDKVEGRATFEPGRCEESPFESRMELIIRQTQELVLRQIHIGGSRQVTKGAQLSDLLTLVTFDDSPGYDEMWVLQAGQGSDLEGLVLYGPEHALPTLEDLVILDGLIAEEDIGGLTISNRPDAVEKLLGIANDMNLNTGDVCDLGVTIDLSK